MYPAYLLQEIDIIRLLRITHYEFKLIPTHTPTSSSFRSIPNITILSFYKLYQIQQYYHTITKPISYSRNYFILSNAVELNWRKNDRLLLTKIASKRKTTKRQQKTAVNKSNQKATTQKFT